MDSDGIAITWITLYGDILLRLSSGTELRIIIKDRKESRYKGYG